MTKKILLAFSLIVCLASPVLYSEASATATLQKRTRKSLIQDLSSSKVPSGCSCYFNRQGRKRYVFLAEMKGREKWGEQHAWMNIDGRDLQLTFVSSTEPPGSLNKGGRFVEKYSAAGVIVQLNYVVTAPAPPGAEVTDYAVTITVTKNNRTQTIRATGECGC
jgi:hypothetical protein